MVVRGAAAHVRAALLAQGVAFGLQRVSSCSRRRSGRRVLRGYGVVLGGHRTALRCFCRSPGAFSCGLRVLRFSLRRFGLSLCTLSRFLSRSCGLYCHIQCGNSLVDDRLLHRRGRGIRGPGALVDGDGHLVHCFAVVFSSVEIEPRIDWPPGEEILIRDGHAAFVADLRLCVSGVLFVAEVNLIGHRQIIDAAELQDLSVIMLPQRCNRGLSSAAGKVRDDDVVFHHGLSP